MSEENVVLNKETRSFETEVKQILKLVVHSLYSNKEIFLRELISNASDALEKLRTAALTQSELYENDSNLKIHLDFNKEAKTITITDNGIGMNKEDAISHLGTIAKSGTREFLELLNGNQLKDNKLIGQFGVGFYSAFIVADKVTVNSRKAGEDASQGVYWESAGEGEFTVENIDKSSHGTEIILHLKEEETEFLDDYRLKNIIRKYSDHIEFPISMKKITKATSEKGDNEEENAADIIEEEVINKATALWTLPKNEIKDEDYISLYKHISHDFEDPLLFAHNKVEGKQEYTTLLYIPARAPFDLFYREFKSGLKLFIQRVFIMDEANQFLPNYLRFVKGIVDSNDLPLNVSREVLQNNRVVTHIRQGIIKRILGLLENLAENEPEKYQKFWKEFGNVLKEGPAEDFQNHESIAKLLRFHSTYDENNTLPTISFKDYIGRMPTSQNKIYYITAESLTAAKSSPHLEIFRKKGIEVLLLADRVDEWLVAHLHEFDGKSLQSVAKGSLDLGEEENKEIKEKEEALEKENKDWLDIVKKSLEGKVKDVKITQRLTSSPACLVSDENEMGGQLKRMLEAAGQDIGNSKPILELNPEHLLIQKLKECQKDSSRFEELALFLYEQAVLSEGGHLEDPGAFVKRVNHFILNSA